MRAKIDTLFLDDGGVMNDDTQRAPEWQRLVAEFFAPLLGGDLTSWVDANAVVFECLLPMLEAGPKGQEYDEWFDSTQLLWLRRMAAHVGVAVPADDAQCIRLAWQASDYVTLRVRASYPGAVEAIRMLHSMGFTLFTASGGHSRELHGYLSGMGVRECFDRLYGADLIKVGKNSAEYYHRLFKHSGVNPNHTLVVDNKPHCLAWASSLGATTCLVGAVHEHIAKANFTVGSLTELSSVLGDGDGFNLKAPNM